MASAPTHEGQTHGQAPAQPPWKKRFSSVATATRVVVTRDGVTFVIVVEARATLGFVRAGVLSAIVIGLGRLPLGGGSGANEDLLGGDVASDTTVGGSDLYGDPERFAGIERGREIEVQHPVLG